MASSILLISALIAIAAVEGINAVKYNVDNKVPGSPGGKRFDAEIGAAYSIKTMEAASANVWKIFQQNPAERKIVEHITLFIKPIETVGLEFDNNIYVNDGYLAEYNLTDPDLVADFDGLIHHEMAHVWQWDGWGKTPTGLIEGIADFVRLKSGYVSEYWPEQGSGDKWDQGYGHTARFLDYCNNLREGFVADLNAKMKTSYSNRYFEELLGKPVDQLWKEYKAKYAK